MPRVWLTCALVTAAVVAVVLILTNRPAAEADGPRAPKAPPPLSEQEIRTYIDIMPQMTQILKDIAMKFQAGRRPGDAADEELGVEAQAQVAALLERRHLTPDAWERLQRRVEYAINAVRARDQLERERAGMEERKKMKEALLENLAREDERELVRKEIAELQALLDGGGPALTDRDRELIRQYWRALDAAAPQVGPPQKPPGEEPTPPPGR